MNDTPQQGSASPSAIIRQWWVQRIEASHSGAARALAARLRRAGPVEALAEPAVFDLARALQTENVETLHRVVTVLAHVRADAPRTLAQRLGAGDPPPLSELRFQRLMRAETEALPIALIRALPMAGRACNVGALGGDLFYWSDRVRTRWIFHYRGAALPEALKETTT